MQAPCHYPLAMPQDQRSDDSPTIGESASQFGFWNIDLRDMALTLSDTACAIYGLGPAACRLDDFLQRVHPDERRRVSDTLHAALRAGARLDVRYRIVRPTVSLSRCRKALMRWKDTT
jgi:hypothetical protein